MSTTNFQDVVNAKARGAELKSVLMSALNEYLNLKSVKCGVAQDAVLKLQAAGTAYFNFYEEFVGDSSLLGAHTNSVWVQGFAEDCFAVLEQMPQYYTFLKQAFENLGSEIDSRPSVTAFANMQRLCKRALHKKLVNELRVEFESSKLPIYGFQFKEKVRVGIDQQTVLTSMFMVVFLIVLIALSIFISHPSPFQEWVYRILASLVAGCAGVVLIGIFEFKAGNVIRFSGGFVFFLVVLFLNPKPISESGQVTSTDAVIEAGRR